MEFICRGPIVVPYDKWRWNLDKWYEIDGQRDAAAAVRFILQVQAEAQRYAVPGVQIALPAVLPEPKLLGAEAKDRTVLVKAKGLVGQFLGRKLAIEDRAPPVDWALLRRAALPLIRLRAERIGKPCGYDMGQEFKKYPSDGTEHESVCPKCGNIVSWRAPLGDS